MPILAVDRFGRFYQTGRDRADGRGYSASPKAVSQRDTTLGAAHLKAQAVQRRQILANKAQLAGQDKADQLMRAVYKRQNRITAMKNQIEDQLSQNPAYQAAMLKAALVSGKMNGVNNPTHERVRVSGNPLTANGQSGVRGMTDQQRAVHAAVTGNLGLLPTSATRVSPSEQRQQVMNRHVNAHFQNQAAIQRAQNQRTQIANQHRQVRQSVARAAWAQGITNPNASRPIRGGK